MPQPKSPKIDWLLEAWNLSTVLVNVPTRPLRTTTFGKMPLDERVEQCLDELQHKLNACLNFGVAKWAVTAKLRAAQARELPRFDGVDARAVIAARNRLLAMGVNLDAPQRAAIQVHAQIAFIRQHRYLDDQSRIMLPAIVASISGQSAALQNAVAAAFPRGKLDQGHPIAEVIAHERGLDGYATCQDVWDRICSGSVERWVRDIVSGCRGGSLHYYDQDGELKSIGFDHFQKLFTEVSQTGS